MESPYTSREIAYECYYLLEKSIKNHNSNFFRFRRGRAVRRSPLLMLLFKYMENSLEEESVK